MAGPISFLSSPFLQAIIILLVAIILKRRYLSSIRDVPGPLLASFSSLWQVYQLCKGHMEVDMMRLHRQHGYFVRISEKEVSVSHPDAIKLVLQAQIHKAPWYKIFCLPDSRYVGQMAETDPKRHAHKQKNVAAGYALSNIIKSEPQVDALIELLETRLDELIKEGKPVEFNRWLNYFSWDVVGEATFSQPFRFLETGTDVGNALANTRILALYVAVMGHYIWFHRATIGHPVVTRLGLLPTSHIFGTCLDAVERRKNNPEVRKDMMAEWTGMREKYPDRMAESEILAAATTNIGAAGDTTSTLLQAMIYNLIRNPQHLSRLRTEIDTAQAQNKLSPVISFAETQDLPFLKACIKESCRFHTPVTSGFPRVVPPEGITIGGRLFTSGTILSVHPWIFHRNPALFGQDADVYNPERWLDAQRAKEMSPFLIHWGAGFNQCSGRNLAQLQLCKVTAQLIRDYDIEQIEPGKEWRFEGHFTFIPYDWPCRLRRRVRSAGALSDEHSRKEG